MLFANMANEKGNPNWVKGVSANPAGKPKGFKGLAERIRAQTKDGQELIDFALSLVHDEDAKKSDRMAALQWLSDRGWGKAVQQVDLISLNVHTDPNTVAGFDLNRLEINELRAIASIVEKAAVSSTIGEDAIEVLPLPPPSDEEPT